MGGAGGYGKRVGHAIAVKADWSDKQQIFKSYSSNIQYVRRYVGMVPLLSYIIHIDVCSTSLFADVMKIPQNYIHMYICTHTYTYAYTYICTHDLSL